MAVLKISEIRKMRPEDRMRKLSELRAELAKQRASIASGAVAENPGAIRAIRKSIARLLTVINEERRASAAEGGGE